MTVNPFLEPGEEPAEQDRTVIRPMPGGSRATVRTAPATQSVAPPLRTAVAPAMVGPDIETVANGNGPLAVAAAPLLHLLARLRNTATAPDPGDMRERTRRELRAFERRARAAGVPMDEMRLAHYALCATLDDVVLNTPWGSRGRWRDEPLAVSLHKDDQAGSGFFDQLRTLRATLPAGLPVMELMFICLSLGMMGPYRTAPDGPAQLERVRHQVFGLIEAARPSQAASNIALSAEIAGVSVPPPERGGVSIWVAGSVALGVLAAVYVGCLSSLNAASDTFYLDASAMAPATMPALSRPPATPPPPPPPEPVAASAASRLRSALADVADVEVIGTPTATIIRIAGASLFPAGNATLAPGELLQRVGQAISPEGGPVRVVGYTDQQSPRTVAFPSKFALSQARAAAVRAALTRVVANPARIVAQGRADSDPVASNATPDGRERNRRIEIVLAPSV